MKDNTINEMKAFLGLHLIMKNSLHKGSYPDYWRSDGKQFTHETPRINEIMRRDRFLAIWSFLHTVEEDQDIDKTDCVYKVCPMLSNFIKKIQKYYSLSETRVWMRA